MITIGHIGNGKSTNRYHLPYSLQRKNTIRIKMIYQRHVRKTMWENIPGIIYTDDIERILNDPEIQVIVVNTSSDSHYAIAKMVLDSGKHCVIEKPFATSLEEAEDLFRIAEQKNLMVQCYQNRRFDSDFLTTQKVIESGKLGKIFEVCMHYDYYRPEVPEKMNMYDRSMAFIYTHACHTVDQVLSYFGKPNEVRCDVKQLLGTGRMNDYFDLDFFYDNNLKVSVQSSYFRAKARPSFEVYGTRGYFVKAEQDRQEADLKKFYMPSNPDFGIDQPENYGTIIYYDDDKVYHEEKVISERGDYGRFYDALVETIENHTPQLVTKNQTLEQMRILELAGKDLK